MTDLDLFAEHKNTAETGQRNNAIMAAYNKVSGIIKGISNISNV